MSHSCSVSTYTTATSKKWSKNCMELWWQHWLPQWTTPCSLCLYITVSHYILYSILGYSGYNTFHTTKLFSGLTPLWYLHWSLQGQSSLLDWSPLIAAYWSLLCLFSQHHWRSSHQPIHCENKRGILGYLSCIHTKIVWMQVVLGLHLSSTQVI